MTTTAPTDALEWLGLAETNPDLSVDAVALAAVLSDYFDGLDKPVTVNLGYAARMAGFATFNRYRDAERELKAARLLSGRGKSSRPYIFHAGATTPAA